MLSNLIDVCLGNCLFITQVPLCVQFILAIGKNIQSKSVHCYDGSVFLCIDGQVCGQTQLNPIDPKEDLCRQFSRVLKDFDNATICNGVEDQKYSSLTYCTGAAFQNGYWRSTNCKKIFTSSAEYNSGDINTQSTTAEANRRVNSFKMCSECYTVKRALSRLGSKPQPLTLEDKLHKLKSDYVLARRKLVRKDDKLQVIF